MDNILGKALEIEPLSNITYRLLGHFVTIFMLHRPAHTRGSATGHAPELLNQCLDFAARKKFHFATPDQIVHLAQTGQAPRRPTLCFTIDDGYADEVQQLCPVFFKYSIPPTIFVLSRFVSQEDWPWDAKLAYLFSQSATQRIDCNLLGSEFHLDLSCAEARIKSRRTIVGFAKTLKATQIIQLTEQLAHHLAIELPQRAPDAYQAATWEELRHFEKQGLNVGSHGCSHFTLNSLSHQEVISELHAAKARLTQELSNPSQIFCYPSGTSRDFSPEHIKLVKDAGYLGALTANPGNTTLAQIKDAPFTILRHAFPNDFETFVRYTSWFEALRTRFA